MCPAGLEPQTWASWIQVVARRAARTMMPPTVVGPKCPKLFRQMLAHGMSKDEVTAVGFEPTHPKIVELESTALDHSAKLS